MIGPLPDSQNTPPTAQDAVARDDTGWLEKANSAYWASTSYVDANFRKKWEDGIRAFNSEHPADSKYVSAAYQKRSHIFRPKTRAVIRKNEAAAAAAFFSNMDTVTVAAEDQSNEAQLASAEVMKALLEYRLSKSIPWFLVVLGGIQDAQVTGVPAAHIYWDFKGRHEVRKIKAIKKVRPEDPEYPTQSNLPKGAFTMGESTLPEVDIEIEIDQTIITPVVDKPAVDLIPIENLRVDPAANWMDPVNSSPYLIHLIPMYIMDVKKKVESGEWKNISEEDLQKATKSAIDTTRMARNSGAEDPQTSDTRAYDDINIVWVHRHIHREGFDDIEFYTLDTFAMLSDPKPLKESVFHGLRPYVMGMFILEAHKLFNGAIPHLNKGLQDMTNEIANQRIDNVKFALNKKWFAKRGRNVDVTGLVRNVPGGVVMMDDPANDVREISWQDVTGSAYEEQNRLNLDMDELMGNFNPAALIQNGGGDAPARNMALLNQANGTLVEYGIRTYVETFVQPVLRQLMLLEQKYETDTVILALCSKKAKLFQRFGIDEVTDDLLNQQLTLTVDVGMGATDPSQKLQKFLTAINSFGMALKMQVPGMNMIAVGEEIFAHLGYRDASRFFSVKDPNVAALQQQLQQAMQAIQDLQQKVNDKQAALVVGLQKTRETNQSKERIAIIQEQNENRRSLATHISAVMSEARQGAGTRKMSDNK